MKKLLNGRRLPKPFLKFDLKMRLTALLLFTVLLGLHANTSYSQRTKITLNMNNSSISQVIDEIEARTEFRFVYSNKQVDATRRVSVNVKRARINEVLELLFGNSVIEYNIRDKQILLKPKPNPIGITNKDLSENKQDPIRITGTVTDENGIPLAGASVIIQGTTQGVSTDFDGSFEIVVPSEQSVLEVSYIGYASHEVTVGNRTTVNVELQESASRLDDVVVVGYGTQEKAKITSSISKVTAQDIENLPVTSFDQALQGLASGVQVSSSSGTPGGPVLIRIRGETSINAGNDPLFVVDGVPVLSSSLTGSSQQQIGGQNNILSTLNPNDIESIEILKDAAATSIYGSRAANGVVLVTTKTGKNQEKTSINFDSFTGFGQATNRFDVLNSEQYLEIKREAFINDNLPIPDFLLDVDTSINTDWQDEIYRTATISQHDLSVFGGNEKTTFYLSAGYRSEQAILKNAQLERGTLRININHEVNDKLELGTRTTLSREKNELFTANLGFASPPKGAVTSIPYFPVRDTTGEFTTPVVLFGTFGYNPVEELLESKFDNLSTRILSSLYFNYNITKDLSFRTDLGVDHTILGQDVFYPSSTLSGSFSNGSGFFALNQSSSYNVEPTLRYVGTFKENHNVDAVAGLTFFNTVTRSSNINGQNFVSDELVFLTSAQDITRGGTNRSDYSFNSIFGRINYDFKSKYLLSASLRRDGSSRFGRNNRYGNFWAVSSGWVFTEESFISSKWLNYGKIRGSYGTTGNDQLGDFPSLSRWSFVQGYGGIPGLAETQPGNPDLGWEETSKLDLGIELSLFNNRVFLEGDYFLSKTDDLLLDRPLPGTTGFNSFFTNIGQVENRGFEFTFRADVIKSKEFNWNISANVTSVDNEIISLANNDEPILSSFSGFIVGEPINIIRGLKFLGVDSETGNAIYEDQNGDEVITEDDAVVLGNTLPDVFGGLTTSFSWKGFSLDALFNYSLGGSIFDQQSFAYLSGGVNRDNQLVRILDRWQEPGDITDIPRVTTFAGVGQNNSFSDRFVHDASYLRLKNLTFSYSFPENILDRLSISRARVYVTGTNLFTITDFPGLDPENSAPDGTATGFLNGNIPQVRMILLGFNVSL